jgi:chorismate synthase
MAGNSFGEMYRITTFGESHGKLIGVVIDGCPPGLELNMEEIQRDMDRRKPGQSAASTQRKESDQVVVNSGVFEGKTTGAPIEMIVLNENPDSRKYENIKDKFRPGQADYTYFAKYGLRDWRGGGRASARETAARVMAGGVAKQILRKYCNTEIIGATVCLGGIEAVKRDYVFSESNILRCPDPDVYDLMMSKYADARAKKDTIGGAVEVVARNVPIGLGEPVFDKLDAVLKYALGSIGAVTCVAIGIGSKAESMLGSEYQDQKEWRDENMHYLSNHAGGIEGGISNGQDIVARLSVKPTPTRIGVPMLLPTETYKNEEVVVDGKHDPIIMPRMVPVAEAMTAIVLTDFLLRQKAYEALGK